MPSHPDSSFAYRASRWAENNRDMIYCHCAKPVVACVVRGMLKRVTFCDHCKGLLTTSQIEDIHSIESHRSP